jgi:hypothetical protein
VSPIRIEAETDVRETPGDQKVEAEQEDPHGRWTLWRESVTCDLIIRSLERHSAKLRREFLQVLPGRHLEEIGYTGTCTPPSYIAGTDK